MGDCKRCEILFEEDFLVLCKLCQTEFSNSEDVEKHFVSPGVLLCSSKVRL
jgi:hypothetical protein